MFFKFIVHMVGKALYEGRALNCHFSQAVYKHMLDKPITIEDMEYFDSHYSNFLKWMLENDIIGIIEETFSVELEEFGVTWIVDLCENSHNIRVMEEK